jgi:hypothetical protein
MLGRRIIGDADWGIVARAERPWLQHRNPPNKILCFDLHTLNLQQATAVVRAETMPPDEKYHLPFRGYAPLRWCNDYKGRSPPNIDAPCTPRLLATLSQPGHGKRISAHQAPHMIPSQAEHLGSDVAGAA